jgi:nickel/cobalt exporter
MMAAFIVAIRGTIGQAVLLGVAATVSHTVIVWAIALGGMFLWRDIAPEALEPWFQLAAGLIVIGIALWILLQTRIGLAITLVAVGAVAAYGTRHVAKRVNWFASVARRAPYVSSVLTILVGSHMSAHGLSLLVR